MTWVLIVMIGAAPFYGPAQPVYKFDSKEECIEAGTHYVYEMVQNEMVWVLVNFKCNAVRASYIG